MCGAWRRPAFVRAEPCSLPQDRSVFCSTLSERDVLVHLPYDSFAASVQRLVVSAANGSEGAGDQAHALYRTSGD